MLIYWRVNHSKPTVFDGKTMLNPPNVWFGALGAPGANCAWFAASLMARCCRTCTCGSTKPETASCCDKEEASGKTYGKWWKKWWKMMENHGKWWKMMEKSGKSWKIMENHGKSWNMMENDEKWWKNIFPTATHRDPRRPQRALRVAASLVDSPRR